MYCISKTVYPVSRTRSLRRTICRRKRKLSSIFQRRTPPIRSIAVGTPTEQHLNGFCGRFSCESAIKMFNTIFLFGRTHCVYVSLYFRQTDRKDVIDSITRFEFDCHLDAWGRRTPINVYESVRFLFEFAVL